MCAQQTRSAQGKRKEKRRRKGSDVISLLDFMTKYDGKFVDADGFYGSQCVDMYRKYVAEVLGTQQVPPVVGAKDIWDVSNECEKIIYKEGRTPFPGDIVIWGASDSNPYGHVAIAVVAGVDRFWSFDQNYPLSSPCHVQGHGYDKVIGWIAGTESVTESVIVIPPPVSTLPKAKNIYGVHDRGAGRLMAEEGVQGWVVVTEAIKNSGYHEYTNISPHIPIVRLNWGYFPDGTIPLDSLSEFASLCKAWVVNSRGCNRWIIGNEPNHEQEWPQGEKILPRKYANHYLLAREKIRSVPGHEKDEVLVAGIAPWNAVLGDWVEYFKDVLECVKGSCDGFCLHTYTHGADPRLIYSSDTMGAPYEHRHYNFIAYRDFLGAVPRGMRHLPVYITETDQDMPWMDEDRAWVYNAYGDIDWWNHQPGTQKVLALVLYRWQNYDKWGFMHKTGVHNDFKRAMLKGYKTP